MKKLLLFLLLFVFIISAEIREYCPDKDYDAVLSIIDSAFEALRDAPEHRIALDVMNDYFDLPGSTTFVYKKRGSVCGFINILEQNPFLLQKDKGQQIGIICLIAFNSEHRNQGLGQQLIIFSLDWFARKNIKRVSLYVHKNNNLAKRFYQKIGFTLLSNKNDPLMQSLMNGPYVKTNHIFVIDLL